MSNSDRNPVPLLIVDAANVVGSVPDGWWRDRRGATERLRNRLAPVAQDGTSTSPVRHEVILVTEGRARGVSGTDAVTVVEADGSGDDTIVELVAARPDRSITVVTADRELRRRVDAHGASVIGPSAFVQSARENSEARRT